MTLSRDRGRHVGSVSFTLRAESLQNVAIYSVEQRTQEIGIRLALGAGTANVRNMVVQQGMGLALAAVVIGIAVALALSRFLESPLFGVKARNPLVFFSVPAMLILVALIAV